MKNIKLQELEELLKYAKERGDSIQHSIKGCGGTFPDLRRKMEHDLVINQMAQIRIKARIMSFFNVTANC